MEVITGKPSKYRQKMEDFPVVDYYINQYVLCREFKSLPRAGGLDDQDYLLVYFFSVIYDAISQLETERKR